ncbi:MAG: SDR family NAD(P)-dependent oxidoreductase [Eubacteriales bacterium]|nr:SDR family NAD(P)-dependent oxidoreductase [Eubacteriales bacterium]
MRIAVITGASVGLGAEFAKQIAQTAGPEQLDELWLVARGAERLRQMADTLPLPCRCFALDLTEEANLKELAKAFADEQVDIRYLVNNAGYGTQGPFAEVEEAKLMACLDLNIRALVQLTHMAKPYLSRESQVFQISSVSAFMPQPNYAVYSSSKTFVLHFAKALEAEWKREGIKVVAVCPNLMATDFCERAEMPVQTLKVKALGLEQPERVVRVALRAGRKGRAVALSSFSGKLLRLAGKLLPHNFILWIERVLSLY